MSAYFLDHCTLCVVCTEEMPEYVIVAIVLGFLLVVVLVVALLAYRCVIYIIP